MVSDTALRAMEIKGLSADSRKIAPGFLFAALPGSRVDGRAFIDEAVKRGAWLSWRRVFMSGNREPSPR